MGHVRRVVLGIFAVAVACNGDAVSPSNVPSTLVSSTQAPSAVVGTILTSAPTFAVLGASGQPIAGIAVTVTVTEGGGAITNPPVRTLAGQTGVGEWTLGTRAGRNALQVKVEGLPVLTVVATGTPGPASQIQSVSGNGKRALAGTTMAEPLVLQVTDEFGNGITGERIVMTVEGGDASLTPLQVTTDSSGRSSAATWRLGTRRRTVLGRATLASNASVVATVRAEFQSDYHIDVRFSGTPSDAIRQAFEVAADRLAGVIIGDAPDQFLANFDPTRCGGPAGLITETVDDVVIYAEVSDIDGPGKVLGRAGPCVTRSTSRHTVVGLMQFDLADVQNLIASGRFEAVVMHEMLHVIGVGSLWRSRNLVEGDVAVDPRFIGTGGTAACLAVGFAAACGIGSVPVENTGGSGTAGAHWRESVFDTELMTGFAEAAGRSMPFSLLTVRSLEDFGYLVNTNAADLFIAPAALARVAPGARGEDVFDIVLAPAFDVLPTGWMRPWR
jgi:hypothetical protein